MLRAMPASLRRTVHAPKRIFQTLGPWWLAGARISVSASMGMGLRILCVCACDVYDATAQHSEMAGMMFVDF